MERFSDSGGTRSGDLPGWSQVLGVVAVVLGIFLCAQYANEWLKHTVIAADPGGPERTLAAQCPEEELEEEGLSLEECRFLLTRVQGIAASMPSGFRTLATGIAIFGVAISLASIISGIALTNRQGWPLKALTVAVALLLALDLLSFSAVVGAGPVLRSLYLWSLLLWILLHLLLLCGCAAAFFQPRKDFPNPYA